MIRAGEHESLKAGIHAGMLALAAVCGVYNACAFAARREPHLARNAVLYASLTVWELVKVAHHRERSGSK